MRCAYFSFQPYLAADPRGLSCASAGMLSGISPLTEVDLIYLSPEKDRKRVEEELRQRFPHVSGIRVENHSPSGTTMRRIQLGLHGLPFSLCGLSDTLVKQMVAEVHASARYDVVHYDFVLWLYAHPEGGLATCPTVCSGTDAYSLAYFRKAKFADNPVERLREWLAGQAFLKFEKQCMPKADFLHLVSCEDAEYLQARGVKGIFRVTNMPIEQKWFAGLSVISPEKYRGRRFLASGQHTYPWYRKGLERLLRNIWPEVLECFPEATLTVHSSHGSPEIERLAKKAGKVKIASFVDDYRHLFRQHDYFIHPLLSGTGQKNRLAIAMSQGLCCIATRAAVSGMGLIAGRDYLPITDFGAEDVKRIVATVGNPSLSSRVGHSGRHRMEAEYSSEVVGRKIFEIYAEAQRLG